MDELVIDNLVYIPSKRAAAVTGYAKDYIGQLCREGRIEAKLVGRSWYVLESSIREHRFGMAGSDHSTVVAGGEGNVVQEEQRTAEVVQETPKEVWESPVYIPEVPKAIVEAEEVEHPTSLENTILPQADTVSQVQEVQNAWQEWFAKNQTVKDSAPQAIGSIHEESEVKETLQEGSETPQDEQVVAREEEVPVKIHRSYPGSMDIGSAPAAVERLVQRSRRERTSEMPYRQGAGSRRLILQATFIAIIVIVADVTVIGTGSLDAFSPTWSKNPGAINYLAGVKIIEK